MAAEMTEADGRDRISRGHTAGNLTAEDMSREDMSGNRIGRKDMTTTIRMKAEGMGKGKSARAEGRSFLRLRYWYC